MKVSKERLKQLAGIDTKEEVQNLTESGFKDMGGSDWDPDDRYSNDASDDFAPKTNSSKTNKKVLYSRAKKQMEEILNTLWDDLDSSGVPEAQAELNKLMAHLQKDMDSGFVGEPT